ncbi:MAG: leucine-rich repeat domain-containing protein [Candidatus Thorarchaeota archaeon]
MVDDEESEQTYDLWKADENWSLETSELTQTMLEDIVGSGDFSSLSIDGTKRREQCRLDNIDFTPLASNKSLKGLGIHGMSGTIDLTPLVNVSYISVTWPWDEGEPPFVMFPESERLEDVQLSGPVDHDRTTLAKLRRLRELSYRDLCETDLSWLNESRSLKHFHIPFLSHYPPSVVLPSIRSLQKLWLNCDRRRMRSMKRIDLTPLASCRHLKDLRIGAHRIQVIDLTPLEDCHKIKVIQLGGNSLKSIDLSPLKSMNLEVLGLGGNRLEIIDLSPLKSMNLEVLGLGGNLLNQIDLVSVSSPSLKTLKLDRNKIRSIDLQPLSVCTNLEELWLDGNLLETLDLSPLSGLSHLKTVLIRKNSLNELDVTPLLSCPSLTELDRGRLKLVGNIQMKDDFLSPYLLPMKDKIEWY